MPFKIELIIADRGWILEKIAKEIEKQCPPSWEMRIATEPSDWGDLHYFIPYSKQPEQKPAISACFFTHQEIVEPAHSNFLKQAARADYCVSMSDKYTRVLEEHGVGKVNTIETGVDLDAFNIRLQIGVVGRTYHTGRKGEDLLAQCMDLKNIEFLFTGSGWPGPSVHLSDAQLPGFFNKLDYLLIPSRIEGGPVPLMEALASGCRVISPSDIGFVEKFPHIPFKNGDASSLRKVLKELVAERQELRNSVAQYSWEKFGLRHIKFFDEIAAERGFARAADERQAVPLKKLYLLSSGIESSHKGGPTTRMALIAKHAQAQGLAVQQIFDAAELPGDDTDSSILHIFNSWPPHRATGQLLAARKKGYYGVYSSIAMNLEHEKYFTSVMPERVARLAGVPSKGKEGAPETTVPGDLRSAQDYQTNPDLMPAEVIPGHFRSLRESVSCADGVLLLSHYEESFLQRVGCELPDHVLIDNGVDSAIMAAGDGRLFKEKYKLDRYVLVVGRIERRKNQAGIAAALANSKLKLVFIGRALDGDYQKLVTRLGGKNLLHIEHLEDRQLLASAYHGASVFLMASWAEGAPLAALEAASAGTPLVLSSMASEQEYFGDDALYVHPLDLEDIASKVLQVADDPELQGPKRRKALSAKYQPRFSAERHAQQTLDFYSKVHTKQFTDPTGVDRPQPQLESTGSGLADLVASRPGEPIKLHLGCGGIRYHDFINVDLYPAVEGVQDQSRSGCVADVFEDIRALGLPAETVDEIYCSHVVEHFVRWDALEMLKDWHRMMKKGGKLVIEMPSFWRCVAWLFHPSKTKRGLAKDQFYGNQWDKLDFETHRYVWGAKEIRKQLKQIGFGKVKVNHRTRTHHPGRDMRIVATK